MYRHQIRPVAANSAANHLYYKPTSINAAQTSYSLPSVASYSTSLTHHHFIPNSPLKPRLESHFKNNLYSDMSILLLENQIGELVRRKESVKDESGGQGDNDGVPRDSAQSSATAMASQYLDKLQGEIREFRRLKIDSESTSNANDNVFNHFLNNLPTNPNSALSPQTRWIDPAGNKSVNAPKQRLRRKLPNPIDYTSVPSTLLHAKLDTPPPPPFTPLPSRMPNLHSISLSITTDEAIGNKPVLLSAIMALQCVSGKRADPVFATKGDASKKIRAGMPIGAKVEMDEEESYHFLDKLVQCVFPRIREWEGLNPVVETSESGEYTQLSFILPSQSLGTFPDIEPHFDSFPRLFDTMIKIKTTGKKAYELLLLLSGLQVVFQPHPPVKQTSTFDPTADDPWAAIKAAKTREERKALFAQMQADHKKALEEKKKRKEEGLD